MIFADRYAAVTQGMSRRFNLTVKCSWLGDAKLQCSAVAGGEPLPDPSSVPSVSACLLCGSLARGGAAVSLSICISLLPCPQRLLACSLGPWPGVRPLSLSLSESLSCPAQ
eukprot:COSAG02_NODE_86_length_39084_cov_17.815724_35_plen_111_part_00